MNNSRITKALVITALTLSVSCNNFFHELVPPTGDRITAFSLPDQIGSSDIGDSAIGVTVFGETDIYSILPRVSVSPKASLLPLTLDYIRAAFPGIDIVQAAAAMNKAPDLSGWVINLIKETPGFHIPALTMPIDFSAPVTFLVISGQGTTRQYTVTVTRDYGNPALLGFRFSQYDNPELISDALSTMDARNITVFAAYPAEMASLSYALVPSFEIMGDSLAVDGVPVVSGQDAVQFSPALDTPQTKTITITRQEQTRDYTLTVYFTEDPDSTWSITDFRFTRACNPDIAADAVAGIVNNGDTGTITVSVLYNGARPVNLIPQFVSPGAVSVEGVTQTSGASGQDFSSPLEYRVVSRNGQYTRRYTVRVEYISLTSETPRITSFTFSKTINTELTQDGIGTIEDDTGEGGGRIVIEARYVGAAPAALIPEFSAQGLVTVTGSVQTSGASAQDFSRLVKYTVTNPENPVLTRDYWVQTRLVSASSLEEAAITAFSFHPAENPGLAAELIADIDQAADRISVLTPPGASRVLLPRVSVSPWAHVLPITADYIRAAFPGIDAAQAAMFILISDADISGYVANFIKRNPDFTVPALTMPIDFASPVTFLVVSGQGIARQYTVTVTQDSGEPALTGFRFSQYDNPELVSDAVSTLDARNVTVFTTYPVEIPSLSYALIPSFEILGDRLEIDGVSVASGRDAVQFSPALDTPQTKTITVSRFGQTRNYVLTVYFTEDPGSMWSITDFRFSRADNPGIAVDAMGSIVNSGNTGTITAQVLYNGARPVNLIPRFVSPGAVSVGGVTQTSGVNGQDFSTPVEYRMVSRNGQYTRVYTVRVEYISLTLDVPRITSFQFSQTVNTALTQDAVGTINDDTGDGEGLITIEVLYGGDDAPAALIPEFSAQGLVTVTGSVQTSGTSAQNFSSVVKYTVTNPQNPLLKRDYRVQTRLVSAISLENPAITALSFHPDENPGLTAERIAAIDQDANRINVNMPAGTGLSLLPRVSLSARARALPLTLEYICAAFPGIDVAQAAMLMFVSDAEINGYVTELIRRNPDFSVPALTMPIDFASPVTFLVVSSGREIARRYTVTAAQAAAELALTGFRFSKYDNPELISDAVSTMDAQTITVTAVYPVETASLSYALIPSFETSGDSLTIDGVPAVSGRDAVQFIPAPGTPQTKTITITRPGETRTYTLTVTFTEDPDTIRSITDFRFTKAANSGIAATAVANIVNNGGTGTITAQVLYSGTRPANLVPAFVCSGTVSADGVPQISGANARSFSTPQEYRVVSRNGQYTRLYTVRVEYISLASGAPRITSFKLGRNINPELAQDAVGEIGESGEGAGEGVIIIEARYGGDSAPAALIPEFSAQGLVTVTGSVQTSGASAQDFSRQVLYTVANPDNPALKRDYRVQTRLIRDTSRDAAITAFSFHPDDNPGLADELTASIDQGTGSIMVYAPVGSGLTSRVMVPRFTAAGRVSVDGVVQSSGANGRVFTGPVPYRVTSADGVNRRDYTVEMRELQSTIYVNTRAAGANDGTSWRDAFISLRAACAAAAEFPAGVPKEIWIAGGVYKGGETTDDYFSVTPNTSYIGGFAGWESAKSQRITAIARVVISGNVPRGPQDIRGAFYHQTLSAGDVRFEELEFKDFRTMGSGASGYFYRPISITRLSTAGGTLTIQNCRFTDTLECIYSSGSELRIQNVHAEGIYSLGACIDQSGAYHHQIDQLDISASVTAASNYANYSSSNALLRFSTPAGVNIGSVTLSNISLQDCWQSIRVETGGQVNVNNITARHIGYNTPTTSLANYSIGVLDIQRAGGVSLANITITDAYLSYGNIIGVANVTGSILLNTVSAHGVTFALVSGRGDRSIVYTGGTSGDTIRITNARLENIQSPYGYGGYGLRVSKYADIYLDNVSFNGNIANGLTSGTAFSGVSVLSYKNLFINGLDVQDVSLGVRSQVSVTGSTSAERIVIDGLRSDCPVSITNAPNVSVVNCQTRSAGSLFTEFPLFSLNNCQNVTLNNLQLRLSVTNYKNLSLSNSNVKSLGITSGSTAETTIIDGVVCNYASSSDFSPLRMIINGSLTVKDSSFWTNGYPSGSSTSPVHYSYITLNSGSNSVFDNCIFNYSSFVPIILNNVVIKTNIFYTQNNAGLIVKNSRFSFNVSLDTDSRVGAVKQLRVINARGGFYLDNTIIRNFYGYYATEVIGSGPDARITRKSFQPYDMELFLIDGNAPYRIKLNCYIGPGETYPASDFFYSSCSDPLIRSAVEGSVEATNGAVITWEP
jgi:hypothetical protein